MAFVMLLMLVVEARHVDFASSQSTVMDHSLLLLAHRQAPQRWAYLDHVALSAFEVFVLSTSSPIDHRLSDINTRVHLMLCLPLLLLEMFLLLVLVLSELWKSIQ